MRFTIKVTIINWTFAIRHNIKAQRSPIFNIEHDYHKTFTFTHHSYTGALEDFEKTNNTKDTDAAHQSSSAPATSLPNPFANDEGEWNEEFLA